MMAQLRKGRSYYKLLDTVRKQGCPICSLLMQDSLGYLDMMMYERIMDVPTRFELVKSFGLCNLHTWQVSKLPEISSPQVGFAILASDLLKKFERLADDRQNGGKRTLKSVFKKAKQAMRPKMKQGVCPVCLHVSKFESYHLKQLLEQLPEEEFLRTYGKSQGICLPHFLLAEEHFSSHPNFQALLEVQAEKARALRDKLDRFIEKQDYRHPEKVTPEEAMAGKIAMEFLNGKPGAFGSEIERGPARHAGERSRR
ncbi:MAG: hypothetical protein GTO40_13510 [Deltaproteobacteria bacterium]|nr:hypothetical protein [Deltaproteobacteria bacterium]